ncbi:GNAT family N-acetyltransferase [Plantactinospora sp. WMMB334]|uniref:GNAT family N-acetyltransferase n=1 Tax=Plantactinospora sp. WMMB334 TaxID=3404119 RepID=UPI003B95D061
MSFLVQEDPARRRFEILVDDSLAGFIGYRIESGTMVLAHTEVDSRFEGKGVGSALARGTLDQLRDRGERVRVTCPFLLSFLERHPEYAPVVVAD